MPANPINTSFYHSLLKKDKKVLKRARIVKVTEVVQVFPINLFFSFLFCVWKKKKMWVILCKF